MINKVTITNFQSHEDTTVELHPRFNAFIGPSDSGKSAIVRALRLLGLNKPSGDSYRSWGGGDTSVTADDITRLKGNNINAYIIEPNVMFKAVGSDVPSEIKFRLNLDVINIQSQLDPPFLLSLSPGEVARYLNKIVNLDKIDSSLLHANGRVKQAGLAITSKECDITVLEQEIEDLNWAAHASKDLDELELLNRSIENMEKAHQSLIVLESEITNEIFHIDELTVNLSAEPEIIRLDKIADEIDSIEQEYHSLVDVVSHIQGEQLWIKEYGLNLAAEPEVDRLMELEAVVDADVDMFGDLNRFVHDISGVKGTIDGTEHKLTNLEFEFNQAMPDVCPLCDQEIV
jgi:DNA repair protein SbcC/Rad50